MKKLMLAFVAAIVAFCAVEDVFANVPRPEYPRPQFERNAYVNLNGVWTFDFDFGQSGTHLGRELFKSKGFSKKIFSFQ